MWLGIEPQSLVSRPAKSVQGLVEIVGNALAPVLRFNDPKGVYSHCFCAFE
jgi:hypothetical protein